MESMSFGGYVADDNASTVFVWAGPDHPAGSLGSATLEPEQSPIVIHRRPLPCRAAGAGL